MGISSDFWNNWAGYNEPYGVHMNVEDGWLPLPDELPVEGTLTASFKWVGKGGVSAGITSIYQVHQNANGELVVEHYTDRVDCDN